jgi:hypothetical protein
MPEQKKKEEGGRKKEASPVERQAFGFSVE